MDGLTVAADDWPAGGGARSEGGARSVRTDGGARSEGAEGGALLMGVVPPLCFSFRFAHTFSLGGGAGTSLVSDFTVVGDVGSALDDVGAGAPSSL